MAMRIFKITNVACVIFLLDSTTLDNYQKTCFHSSTYSPSEKHSSQLLVTLRKQTTPTCEVDDAKLHGLCLPLQLPSGDSLQSCGSFFSRLSRLAPGSRALQAVLAIRDPFLHLFFSSGPHLKCHLLREAFPSFLW